MSSAASASDTGRDAADDGGRSPLPGEEALTDSQRQLRESERALDEAGDRHDESVEVARETTRELSAQRQRHDPDGKREGSLPLAAAGVAALSLVGIPAANRAAEVLAGLNDDLSGRWAWLAAIVAQLALAAALLSAMSSRRGRTGVGFKAAFAFATVTILTLSTLRLGYLLVVGVEWKPRLVLEPLAMALLEISVIWAGWLLLERAEPFAVYNARRKNKNAKADEARSAEAKRQAERRWKSERTVAKIRLADDLIQNVRQLAEKGRS